MHRADKNATSCVVTITVSTDLSTAVGGYWIAVGIGTGMAGSSVVIAKVDAKRNTAYEEHNITTNTLAGLGVPVASSITQSSLSVVNGKTVRSRPSRAIAPLRRRVIVPLRRS